MYALERCQLQFKEEGRITYFVLTAGFFQIRSYNLVSVKYLEKLSWNPSCATDHNCYVHQFLCCKENIYHKRDTSSRKRSEICVCMCVCVRAYGPDYWLHMETHCGKERCQF